MATGGSCLAAIRAKTVVTIEELKRSHVSYALESPQSLPVLEEAPKALLCMDKFFCSIYYIFKFLLEMPHVESSFNFIQLS